MRRMNKSLIRVKVFHVKMEFLIGSAPFGGNLPEQKLPGSCRSLFPTVFVFALVLLVPE